MSLRTKNFPYAYYRGKVFRFAASKQTRFSFFGGPARHLVGGVEHGPHPLHHVMTIWNRDLDIPGYDFGNEVPLLYGLCFDGCRLEYKRTATRAIELTKLTPASSSDDWPYPYYPLLLPYVPLEVEESQACSLDEFSSSVMQGVKSVNDSEVLVVVPPNPEIGMSIWGLDGDADDVQIIFRYDTQTGVTKAYNACT
jgi:hypothetical protein